MEFIINDLEYLVEINSNEDEPKNEHKNELIR